VNTKMEASISPDNLQLVRLITDEGVWFIGYIIDDAIRVLDVVTDGQSAAEMTGCRLRLKPITFDYLRSNNISWHIEPHEQPLPALEPPERWPTPEEVLEWRL